MSEREQSHPRGQAHSEPAADPGAERRQAVRKAIERHAKKLARKLDGLRGDMEEALAAKRWTRHGEALLTYKHQVPARAKVVTLPDPHEPERTLEIELDPSVSAPTNAARYFKRAAKAERGQREIPPRIEAVERELRELRDKLERAADAERPAASGGVGKTTTSGSAETAASSGGAERAASGGRADAIEATEAAQLDLERVLASLSASTRQALRAPEPLPRRKLALAEDAPKPMGPKPPTTPAAKRGKQELPAKFVPWRFKSKEGWDVLIGRSSEANDHLTLHIARPEDYWFHAHGCAGSHVVLRRGKGANEPSKATLVEVASWAAFHSKLRSAGKAPVIFTQKKYVRKPRGTKPGTVYVEREKLLMVRPMEPPREQMADGSGATPDIGDPAS